MTEKYKTAKDVWEALAAVSKGEERAKIIKTRAHRKLILNSGSFVVFSTGEPDQDAETLKDQLQPIRLLQSQRLAIKTAAYDGKGTFGGLSERTKPGENLLANMTVAVESIAGQTLDQVAQDAFRRQLERLVTLKDDLNISNTGEIEIVDDLSQIARTTAAREAVEEISEIVTDFDGALKTISGADILKKLRIDERGLSFIFQAAALTPVPLASVKDDNYVTNIWDGNLKIPAYAVTPFGHLITLDDSAFDYMIDSGKEAMEAGRKIIEKDTSRQDLIGREILGIEDVSLFDALKQWGKYQENGERDLSHDYRYPHEWMAVWHKAQISLGAHDGPESGGLGFRETVMIELMREVQNSIIDEARASGGKPHNVDLLGALKEMNGGHLKDISQLEGFEEDFGLPYGTFYNMHKAAEEVMTERGYSLSAPVVVQAGVIGESRPASFSFK